MLIKSDPDEIQSFLSDASHMRDGHAERVVFPESAEEVAEILRGATRDKTPVTVSGAGTGTVGGRIPFAGIVLATDKLNQIRSIVHEEPGGSAVAEAGVRLSDLQRFVESENLFYPPDPTERSCFRRYSGDERIGRAHVQVWADEKLRSATQDCPGDWRLDRSSAW